MIVKLPEKIQVNAIQATLKLVIIFGVFFKQWGCKINIFVLLYSIIFLMKCKMFFSPSYANSYFLHLQKTSEKQMLSEDIEKHQWHEMNPLVSTQPATTCSKLTTETLEGKSRLTNFCANKIFSEIFRRNIMLRLSALTVSNNGPSSICVLSCRKCPHIRHWWYLF